MNYKTSPNMERQTWHRLAATIATLCMVIVAATFFSGSFFKLNTLQAGEVFDASPASAQSEAIALATETTTPGATGTTTTTPGSTETVTGTPGSTETTTTTPGSTGTTTPGSTGTTTGTPGATGTTTGTPGATGTTTGTPGPGCTPSGNVNVSIMAGGFDPSTVNINAGTSVTWINNSGSRARIRDVGHVIFDSGDIPAGGSWTYTFCFNGSFQYENQRGSGLGWVIVGGGGSVTPNPSGTTTGTTTPGATGTTTTTPGSTGTTTPGSTTTTTPGGTGTTTPNSTTTTTTTTTPNSTGTIVSTTTGTPNSTGTTTPGTTETTTPGSTTTTTPGSTTTPGACVISFTDVPQGSTFYQFVQCLSCQGILGGYPDGTFRPNNTVTRGQLAKIVSNAAGYNDTPAGQSFSDVPTDHTFYMFIERMMMHGVLGGYPDGTFRPGDNATRGQIAKIVANAAGYNNSVTGQSFADVAEGSTFYIFVERLAVRDIMSGYACGGPGEPCSAGNLPYFRPANDATRGQVAKIVSNTFFPNCTP